MYTHSMEASSSSSPVSGLSVSPTHADDALSTPLPAPSAEPSSSHYSADDPVMQAECDALVSSDNVDKDTALGIARLHSAMERHALRQHHDLMTQIECLRCELMLLRLTHRNADMLTDITADVGRLKARVDALETQPVRRR